MLYKLTDDKNTGNINQTNLATTGWEEIKIAYRPSFIDHNLLSEEEIKQIRNTMENCLNAFLNGTGAEWFAFGDVFGGYNNPWREPLVKVYDKYLNQTNNKQKAEEKSALDLGRMLKIILRDDERNFIIGKKLRNGKTVNVYKLSK